jgi:hypothetical protein
MTAESRTSSLLGNGLLNRFPQKWTSKKQIEKPVSKQRMGKQKTIGVLLETVFSIRSVQSGYKEEFSWE